MTRQSHISSFISRLVISLLLLAGSGGAAQAQQFLRLERDTVPLLRGFAVGFDVVGLAQMQFSDYGQYEGAVRLNLHDQYFPTVEVGLGRANHVPDETSVICYKTSAPYFRVGADVNIMKKKHTGNRVYAGVRYGFTAYKVDITSPQLVDPVWQRPVHYGVEGEACSQHWAEVLFGLEAKVAGPLHLGWSVRFKRRLFHNDGLTEKTWYVPGYGTQGTTKLGAAFYVTIDI